jgi:hypothetical protein
MKRLFLLGIPLLAVSACAPQPSPPPAAVAAAAPYALGSAANTTTAFDGNYGAVIVRQVSPGCADPRFSDVNLTIHNGLAQAQGLGLTFQGYVTPQGALAMQSDRGQTFQGQIGPTFVLTGRAQGPNCIWDVNWNRVRAL